MAGGLVGYARFVLIILTSLHIWAAALVGLLLSFLKSPHTFFRRKPRSLDDFPDILPGLVHEYHKVNGVRLHVVIAGKARQPGSKRLLLCVHGFPESHISWRHQLDRLSDEYEVAAIDLRGYGKSDKPRGRSHYRMHEMVQDLVELIGALGHDKCILVGHDWGAAIAWRFAAFHQDMLHALVCLAAPPGQLWLRDQTPEQKKKSAYVWMFQMPVGPELLWAAHDYAAISEVFVDGPMAVRRKGAISAEDVERYKANMQQPYTLTAGLNYYRSQVDAATWNPSPRGKTKPQKITVPTLFIGGEQDGALSKSLFKNIDEVVRDPEMHWLPECSHWVQQDQPEEVNRLVTKFLGTAN